MVIKGYKKKPEPTQDVKDLKRLIDKWRETDLAHVRSCDVVPDSSNRSHTGLSVDHVHYIATRMMRDGFHSRRRGPLRGQHKQPHDIPVLVRGSPGSAIAVESLEVWRGVVDTERHFPRVAISDQATEWFCSLGNGHFTQALNCFRQQVGSIFTGEPFEAPAGDAGLAAVLKDGVESVVLREDTPIEVRRELAYLLNATHDYKWTVTLDGEMDISPESCALHKFTNFEAISKTLDNEALTQLVRLELGVAKEMDERWDAEYEKKQEEKKKAEAGKPRSRL